MKTLLILLLLLPSLVMAEIHKEAQVCGDSGKICFFWWPKLPEIEGWHQDIDHSYHYRMNTQAPNNYTFSNAETVIYASAEFRDESYPEKTLEEFISVSQDQFIKGAPSELQVKKIGEPISKGKHKFISYSFYPKGEGNWEQISYAEDQDADGNKYFIIVALSSRSKNGFDQNIDAYKDFVSQYK